MTASVLPSSPAGLAKARWEDIVPFFEELAERPLEPGSIEGWLQAWSTLEELVTEAAALAMIAYTIDTSDPEKEADHLRFSTEILPKMEERSVALARRLVDSGYATPELATTLARFRTAIEIFREANVPIFADLEELNARYQRITGSMTALWDGVERPLPQLQPFLKSNDRAVRERAFRAATQPYIDQHEALAGLFDRMYELRQRAARNAGFANFRDYVFPAKFRFDYTPADCERFHDAVERTVAPAVERMLAVRRERLGLDRLRPWDLAVDPYRSGPLRPFETAEQFVSTARRVFDRVDPVLGREFQTMIDEGLLDLDSRRGKAPGGYCETLHHRGRPFIFMNAVGLVDDVMTLLHEAGHAFHAFASHRQPLIWQRHPGSEAAELASMSMELLAGRHLTQPTGFFSTDDHRSAWLEHLEDILLSLVHIASVDAYQTWIYTSGEGGDAAARDAAWLRIRARFERGVDWSGLERERVARWYRQLHIFMYPFYYIEYGIAQVGALQIWRNSLRDPGDAVARYREALALGAVRSLPEMYQAAGARLSFDAETLGPLVDLIESEIARIRAQLPGR
ncbi:MAG TPA: M3 family oligoendopeptidase [Candidatus Polarisedimenticolia bacterium]|nr:M3 family oligoendopeptidase [Candidatus Polarisedimenticolia bacterium]